MAPRHKGRPRKSLLDAAARARAGKNKIFIMSEDEEISSRELWLYFQHTEAEYATCIGLGLNLNNPEVGTPNDSVDGGLWGRSFSKKCTDPGQEV